MPTIEKDTAELENKLTNAQDLTQFIETNEHDIPELSVSQYLEQLLNKYQLNRAEIITASCIVSSSISLDFCGLPPLGLNQLRTV